MSTQATVLYDAPGPRARAAYRTIAIVSVVAGLALAALVLLILGRNGQLAAEKWTPFLKGTTWTTYLLPGLVGTIVSAVLSIVLAMALGLCSAWAGSRRAARSARCPGRSSRSSAPSRCSSS